MPELRSVNQSEPSSLRNAGFDNDVLWYSERPFATCAGQAKPKRRFKQTLTDGSPLPRSYPRKKAWPNPIGSGFA